MTLAPSTRTTLATGALALLVLAAVLHAVLKPDANLAGADSSTARPRYALEGLSVLRTDESGAPALRVNARTGEYFDGGAAHLKDIRAEGLSGTAAPWALLAPQGETAAGDPRVKLLPPVTGTGRWPDGGLFNLAAQTVWLSSSTGTVSSTEPVRLDSPSRSAHARGFNGRLDGSALQLTQVEMRYVPTP